ncbi:hypothetical protein DFH27DRAFT_551311 [Peziza echinospora]|nr:hypothetical protein DFH27DRAFT_551311 [Peziza echinospora]
MRDAEPLGAEVVQPAREGRRSSLIVKLAAPSTVLRKFNEHAASAPAITDEFFKASPSVAPVPKYTGSARSQIKKSAGNPPRYSDIIREMHHFGESRMEQIVATSREKYDDYLIRIRELDAQKEKIRRELMRISEEGTAKSRQFDEKLSHMLFEADVLDNRARRGRAGMSSFNAFLPPDRDLSWSKYQELVQEKADHETDVAAAREKLVRRGMSINEEKIRIVRMQEESAKWDKKLNDMREAKKLELLVLEQPLGIVADVVANTGITSSAPSQTAAPPESEAPSPRAQSAAIPGTGPNEESEPPLPAPATVQSSATETPGPSSSIFSSSIDLETSSSTPPQAQPGAEADTEAESTDNTSTPQPQLLPHGGRKVNPQDLGRALIDTSGGYAAILLASIRNAALLPDSDEGPPSSSIKMPPLTQSSWYGVGGGAYSAPTTTTEAAASLQRKKKKVRARKGW